MRLSRYARGVVRESRGAAGRLIFFTACLSVGVAAVTAVAGLSESIDGSIRSEARTLLAADLAIESRRPAPEALTGILESLGAEHQTTVKEIPTVAFVPGDRMTAAASLLVEVKAVGRGYPYYGELALSPEGTLQDLLSPETAVVAPQVLERLDLAHDDVVMIGGKPFRVAGSVLREPDRISFSISLGPRIFLSESGLRRAGLEGFGSRILHRTLVKMPGTTTTGELEAAAATLRRMLPDAEYVEVETYAEAQPALRSGLLRVGRFLGIVALLSLLVGGIGVAQAVRAWLSGRIDAIAILKSLGMRHSEILGLYLGQTILLGAAGSVLGIVLGFGIQAAVPLLLGGILPEGLSWSFEPMAALRGLLLGIGVALLFSLPSLMEIGRVSPARVFRHDAEPLRGNRAAWCGAWGALLVGIGVMAVVQSGSLSRGLQFTAGLVGVSGVLAAAGLALARLIGSGSRGVARVWLRHGLTALSRPGAGTLGAILALGLGVLVVVSISIIQSRLRDQLVEDLPGDSPSAFLIDIRPEQWPEIRELLAGGGASRIDSVPVVTARLRSVDGRRVADLLGEHDKDRRRWVLTREQRLTSMKELPADNEVIRGSLWSDPARDEISVEQSFADELGADVGSVFRFDLQGMDLELIVTSIRSVEWETFGINFFLVVEPGVLERAPQTRVAVLRLPAGSETEIRDRLAASFPNVLLLDIGEILEKIAGVMERIGTGIRVLGGFSVLSGVAILGGAISAGSVRRAREVALLKTLGMTRKGVVAVFSVEYALIGLVAGIIGSAGGGFIAWIVLTRMMEVAWVLDWASHAAAVVGCITLTIVAGLAASLGALRRRPVEVLRAE